MEFHKNLTGTPEIELYSHLTESTNIILQNASYKYFYTCQQCTLEFTSPEHVFRHSVEDLQYTSEVVGNIKCTQTGHDLQ